MAPRQPVALTAGFVKHSLTDRTAHLGHPGPFPRTPETPRLHNEAPHARAPPISTRSGRPDPVIAVNGRKRVESTSKAISPLLRSDFAKSTVGQAPAATSRTVSSSATKALFLQESGRTQSPDPRSGRSPKMQTTPSTSTCRASRVISEGALSMRDRHHPRVCRSCQTPMAGQEDSCWRCGTRWASEDTPRTTLRATPSAPPLVVPCKQAA